MKPAYRVVRFSPSPEFLEPVNVALLLVDDKARLVSDDKFAKLDCISGHVDLGLIRFLFDAIQEELVKVKPEEAHRLFVGGNAQLQISEPYSVPEFTTALEEMLVTTYLRRPRRATPTDIHRNYVESSLDQLLESKLRIPAGGFLKRAAPSRFLSPQVKKHLQSNGFKVSRVFNGNCGLVLLDGLNLDAAEDTIRLRAQDIGYAYYSINSARDALREFEGRDLLRASVVFHPESLQHNPKLKYSVETLKRESDMFVNASNEADRVELAKKLSSFSEGLLSPNQPSVDGSK